MKTLFITLCFIAISITSVFSQQIVGQTQAQIKKQMYSDGYTFSEHNAEENIDFFYDETANISSACWYDSNRENYCYQYGMSGNYETIRKYNLFITSIKKVSVDRGDGKYMNYAAGLAYYFSYDTETDIWLFFSIDIDYLK